MRRALAISIALGGAWIAVAACSAFSGSNSPTPLDAGADANEDEDASADAATADATQQDGSTFVCAAFDASAFDPPDGDVTNYTCNGVGGKNLLGDPQNCGWCGHACLGTLACKAGICGIDDAVAGVPNRGSQFVLEQAQTDGVHWHSQMPGTLYLSPFDTQDAAAAREIARVDAAEPHTNSIYGVVRDDRIYIRSFGNMYAAPLDGGALTLIYQGYSDVYATAVAGHLLFETFGTAAFFAHDKFDGSFAYNTSDYAHVQDLAATPDGRYVFFIARAQVDAGVLPDGGGPYVGRGTIERFTVATNAVSRLVTTDTIINEDNVMLAADDTFAYFADPAGGIWSVPVDAEPNSTPTLLRPPNGENVLTMTVSDGVIYWFASDQKTSPYQGLYAISRCGGSVRTYIQAGFLTGIPNYSPANISVHDPYIYWAAASNEIARIAK